MNVPGWRSICRAMAWAAPILAVQGVDVAHAAKRDCDYCPEVKVVKECDTTETLFFGVYEVTRREFSVFLEDNDDRDNPEDSCGIWDDSERRVRFGDDWPHDEFWQRENHPMICVSWDDANAYAGWLSKKTGDTWRLLSDAEWECVARAGTTTPFNTGETIPESQAAYGREWTAGKPAPTVPVDEFGENPFGLYGVHGNVWEWTADCWRDDPQADPRARTQGADEKCSERVLRGGSWHEEALLFGRANRSAADPGDRTAYYGFRVARACFRDCEYCPCMVVVPAGSFIMGSPESEGWFANSERPLHRVRIGSSFAVGVHEVTRGEFGHFVSATGHSMGDSCWTRENGDREDRSGRGWLEPGFSQTDSHPVVCVSWEDAQAYASWLSRETGESYRLLSESEWEYVARAGTSTPWYWGDSSSSQCRYGNGEAWHLSILGMMRSSSVADCVDGYYWTSPVGSFGANAFGLHDVLGNVKEWTQDCWNGSYAEAPDDGSAWESGRCSLRVLRGGSWNDGPRYLRAAYRVRSDTGIRIDDVGFRVARTFTP